MAPKKRCSKRKKIEEVILVKQRNNLMMKMTERQNALMKKRMERQKRPWSDLPADLLMAIMARNYSSTDQIRFRAVCKSWQQLPIDHDSAEESAKLPWVVTGDWTDNEKDDDDDDDINNDTEMSCVFTCKLFDPKHSNPYSVNKILFRDRKSNQRTRICPPKHGWLLFEKRKHINLTSSFLFSPFTQQFSISPIYTILSPARSRRHPTPLFLLRIPTTIPTANSSCSATTAIAILTESPSARAAEAIKVGPLERSTRVYKCFPPGLSSKCSTPNLDISAASPFLVVLLHIVSLERTGSNLFFRKCIYFYQIFRCSTEDLNSSNVKKGSYW